MLEYLLYWVFVNTFTVDYKYHFPDYENLSFPIQMQLS